MQLEDKGWTIKENILFWGIGAGMIMLFCILGDEKDSLLYLCSMFCWGGAGKITSRVKFNKIMKLAEKRAAIDEKTGVLTRDRFLLDFEREVKSSKRNGGKLSVILIEADNIMEINEKFDRKEGDVCLTAIGLATQKSLRDTDYLGRVGGLLFCALLTETNENQCKVVFNRVGDNIRQIARSHSKGLVKVKYKTVMSEWCQTEGPEDLLLRLEREIKKSPLNESSDMI